MCEKCDQIIRALGDAKMRAKSEHRDLARAGSKWKAAEADGGYHALRRFEIEAKKICGNQ